MNFIFYQNALPNSFKPSKENSLRKTQLSNFSNYDVFCKCIPFRWSPNSQVCILDFGFSGTCLFCSGGPSQAFISLVQVIQCVLMYCYRAEKKTVNTETWPCVKSQHAFIFLIFTVTQMGVGWKQNVDICLEINKQ